MPRLTQGLCSISICTGLSPINAGLSRPFQFIKQSHWAFPLSLVTTEGISIDFFSYGYLDISVPRVRLANLCIQLTITLRLGFPIQRFPDHSSLATPRNFSQPATSFIAYTRQGIRQMPFVYLYSICFDNRSSYEKSRSPNGSELFSSGRNSCFAPLINAASQNVLFLNPGLYIFGSFICLLS